MTFIILLFLFSFFYIPVSNAYLEPGILSMIVQTIVAGIVGVLVTLKLYFHKIEVFFSKKIKKINKKKNKIYKLRAN